jgi:hypothetical protein
VSNINYRNQCSTIRWCNGILKRTFDSNGGKRCCLGWQFLKEERKAWEIHLSFTLGEGPTFQIWVFICNLATLGDCCSPFFFLMCEVSFSKGALCIMKRSLFHPCPPTWACKNVYHIHPWCTYIFQSSLMNMENETRW